MLLFGYIGEFENPAYGSASITLANGKLVLHFHSFASDLEPFQYDTFIANLDVAGKTRLTFFTNEKGDIDKLEMIGASFERKAPPLQGK